MAAGDKVLAQQATNVMNKIKEMRTKWGSSSTEVITFDENRTTLHSDVSKMIDWLADGKSRSKWTGTVPAKPASETLLVDIMDQLYNTADAIKNYCACNCNYCSCNCNYCRCNCNYSCSDCSCTDGSDSNW